MRTFNLLRTKMTFLHALVVVGSVLCARLPQGPGFEDDRSFEARPLVAYAGSAQAVADFDGDHLPDRAELISEGFHKTVRLTLSAPWVTYLCFSSDTQEPGTLRAEDVDRDSYQDLIWISDPKATHIALWLNDGAGGLARVLDPAAFTANIQRLVTGGRWTIIPATPIRGCLKATGTSVFSLSAGAAGQLLDSPRPSTSQGSPGALATSLPPCVSRYPKRGPPAISS
jgi:hypothetical protein